MIADILDAILNTLKRIIGCSQRALKFLTRLSVLLGAVLALSACSVLAFSPKIDDHWNYKTNLISLYLNQPQTIQGSISGETAGNIFGAAGYVNGQVDGKPVLYMYIRYKDEHGAIIDKLLPREKVSLREDTPDKQGYVEFKGTWERTATKQEFRENRHKTGLLAKEWKADNTASPRPCFAKVEDCWDGASKDQKDVDVIVHIPAGSVIPEVDPNTIRK